MLIWCRNEYLNETNLEKMCFDFFFVVGFAPNLALNSHHVELCRCFDPDFREVIPHKVMSSIVKVTCVSVDRLSGALFQMRTHRQRIKQEARSFFGCRNNSLHGSKFIRKKNVWKFHEILLLIIIHLYKILKISLLLLFSKNQPKTKDFCENHRWSWKIINSILCVLDGNVLILKWTTKLSPLSNNRGPWYGRIL